MLDDELQILTDIFGQNGYPLGLVQKNYEINCGICGTAARETE